MFFHLGHQITKGSMSIKNYKDQCRFLAILKKCSSCTYGLLYFERHKITQIKVNSISIKYQYSQQDLNKFRYALPVRTGPTITLTFSWETSNRIRSSLELRIFKPFFKFRNHLHRPFNTQIRKPIPSLHMRY